MTPIDLKNDFRIRKTSNLKSGSSNRRKIGVPY